MVVDVAVVASVTVTMGDVLPTKLLSPSYCAMIEFAPDDSVSAVSVATPSLRFTVPSGSVPLKNSTLPVGVPVPGLAALTVAVRVTVWPETGDVGKYVTAVDELACWTVTVTADEVLEVSLLSPE